MKMIDEKGKLFGKLNIIDLLVIVVIIAALVLVGVKIAGKGGSNNGGGTKLTYTVKVSAVSQAVFESIKTYLPGDQRDQLMANGAMLDAYVTEVSATPHKADAAISTMNGSSLVIPIDSDTLDLTFTIEANIVNTVTQEVGTQEVRVGKRHIVKTVNFELVDGIIETIVYSTEAED